jgi:hypothetical protein
MPPPKKKKKLEEQVCYICQDFVNVVGHVSKWCPQAVCRQCHQNGHVSKVCPSLVQHSTKKEVKSEDPEKDTIIGIESSMVQQDQSLVQHSTKTDVKSEDPEKYTVKKEEFTTQEQNALDLILDPLEVGSSQSLTVLQDVCINKFGEVGPLRSIPDCKVFNVSGSTTKVQGKELIKQPDNISSNDVVTELTISSEEIVITKKSTHTSNIQESQTCQELIEAAVVQENIKDSVSPESAKNLNQTNKESIIQPLPTKQTSSSEKSEQLSHQEDHQTLPIKLGIPLPVYWNTGQTIIQTSMQSQSQYDIVPAKYIINIFLSKLQVIQDCQLRSHQPSAPWIAEIAVEEDLKTGTKVKCLEVTSSKHFHLKKDKIYDVYCGRYLMFSGNNIVSTSLTNDVGHLSIGSCKLYSNDVSTQNYCKRTHDFVTLEGVSLQPHVKTRIKLSSTNMQKAQKCSFERHAIIVQPMVPYFVISSAYLV